MGYIPLPPPPSDRHRVLQTFITHERTKHAVREKAKIVYSNGLNDIFPNSRTCRADASKCVDIFREAKYLCTGTDCISVCTVLYVYT